jgi:hypothetical protein
MLIIIQFIHPRHNVSAASQPNQIAGVYRVPDNVHRILAKACLDCHSNNTRYKWYFKIQPVDWWLTSHINDGKEQLNFDEFADKPIGYKYHKLEGVAEQVKKGGMPLKTYLWVHKDAILTGAEKDTLISWANAITAEIKAKYPADSLARKKGPQQD